MQVLVPAGAVALAAIPAILVLYFLKVRGPDVKVASGFLWPMHRVDRQANAPWKRLRISRLLLAQLLVAAAVALALMRPGFEADAVTAGTTVVLLDASPTMSATDVEPSRFGAAVARTRDLIDNLGAQDQMAVVLMGAHARLLSPATSDRDELRQAIGHARPGPEPANLDEGVSLANALLAGRSGGEVVIFGDGHARRPDTPPTLAAGWRYEALGASGENVAVEAMGRTNEGDVFVRVTNFGSQARDLRLQMIADGSLADVLSLRVEANSSTEPVWRRLPAQTRALEARLDPPDQFGLDDAAWLVTAPVAARKVLLVSDSGDGFLARALRVRADLEVTVQPTGGYEPGPFDLYVFDRFVPPGPLPEPAILVAPPTGEGPVPLGPDLDAGAVLPADARDPILQYVSFRDVHVQAMSKVDTPPGWRTVVGAANGPLLILRQGDGRVAQFTFDIHRSDLPLRAAFPVLIQNLVSYLMPGASEGEVSALGQPVRISASAEAQTVEVVTPSGVGHVLAPPFPTTFSGTDQPGLYRVRVTGPAGDLESPFIVAMADPSQSRIAPGEAPIVRVTSREVVDKEKATREIWPWLVGLALMAVAIESVLFLRG